jgi:hypothetical protein
MAMFDFGEIPKNTCNAGVRFGPGYFFIKKSSVHFGLDAGRKILCWTGFSYLFTF